MDLELGCVGVEAGGGFASAFLSGEGESPGVSPHLHTLVTSLLIAWFGRGA